MTKNKKWQCPRCSRRSSRRWNIVVHIRRKHGGVGRPINIENSSWSRNTPFSNLEGTHIVRRPSPTYNFNRSSINYSNPAGKDKGDMIDEMHQMLTEIEKRRRKWEEIIEIVSKYQPFPIQTPNTDVSNATINNNEKIVPQNIPRQEKPHSQEFLSKLTITRLELLVKILKPKMHLKKSPQVKIERLIGGRFELNIWYPILMAINGT